MVSVKICSSCRNTAYFTMSKFSAKYSQVHFETLYMYISKLYNVFKNHRTVFVLMNA